MERRAALMAAVSGAVTLAVATVALAAVGGANMLGFGDGVDVDAASAPPGTDLLIIDRVVVVSTPTTVGVTDAPTTITPEEAAAPTAPAPPAAPARGADAPAPITSAAATPATPPTTSAPTTTPTTPTTAAPSPTAPPTTTRPTTTTTATTTGTTLPPGARIPSDWPPERPIPPLPANCKKPVLEDNGIWNCEH